MRVLYVALSAPWRARGRAQLGGVEVAPAAPFARCARAAIGALGRMDYAPGQFLRAALANAARCAAVRRFPSSASAIGAAVASFWHR